MANYCSECGSALSAPKASGRARPAKPVPAATKPSRGPTAYIKRYSKAFKKHAPRFKKKNGGWKQDGYKKTVKAAHKEAGR